MQLVATKAMLENMEIMNGFGDIKD